MAFEDTLHELGARLERARLDRNLTQAELAHEAGISKRTLERMEAGGSVQLSNLVRVLHALGLAERLDLLLPEAEARPMELLRRAGQTRRRASGRRRRERADEPWSWDDES